MDIRHSVAEAGDFVSAVGRRISAYVTGGIVAAVVAVLEHFTGKSISWTAVAAGLAVAFVVACFLAWRDERRRAEALQRQATSLQEDSGARVDVRHDPECWECDGPAFVDDGYGTFVSMPALGVEIRNVSAQQPVRSVCLAIEEIFPRPDDMRIIKFPIEIARWDTVNAGEPPRHTRLLWSNPYDNIFVIPGHGHRRVQFGANRYALYLVVHADGVRATRATFDIEPGAGDLRPMWRLVRRTEETG